MHTETERKFLVRDLSFMSEATACHQMTQGYISHKGGNTVRVRISDGRGYLTIKGPSSTGISRPEWEKEISLEDAESLLGLCPGHLVEKTRYIVPVVKQGNARSGKNSLCERLNERFFEVDVFSGDNEGLIVAEIELGSEDENFPRPSWLGQEVTGERRYYNSHLSEKPFKTWSQA